METKVIKKHWNKNEYYFAGNGLWVRNLTIPNIKPIDINSLIPEEDMSVMLNNEIANRNKMNQNIATEAFNFKKIIIVGNGYKFEEKQKILPYLPPDVVIIGVNEVMCNWNVKQKMHFYVVNNPYKECLQYLPNNKNIFPRCISSTRTYPDFTLKLNSNVT